MYLLLAVGAITFGRDAAKPARAALFRTVALFVATGLAGILLGAGTRAFTNGIHLSGWQWSCSLSYASELCILSGLLASYGVSNSSDRLSQILAFLPVRQHQRYAALLLPALAVSALALLLALPSLVRLSAAFGLSPILSAVSIMGGLFAAIGLTYGLTARLKLFQAVAIPAALWLQYWLLSRVNNPLYPYRTTAALLFGLVILALVVMLLGIKSTMDRLTLPQRTRQLHDFKTPYSFKKLVRGPTTKLGLIVTLLICIFAAAALRKQHIADVQIPALVGMFLSASFATDARALAKQYSPPEIIVLRGSEAFAKQLIVSTAFLGFAAATPLLILVPAASQILTFASYALAGIGIGTLVGITLVPEHRDISGQCITALLCILLLFALSKAGVHGNTLVSMLWCTSGVCMLAAVGMEYQRNKYRWRKNVTRKQP